MTGKQKKALAALVRAPTREQAAREAGCSTSSIRRWMSQDPAFREAYKEAFSEMMTEATRETQRSMSPAITTLKEIVENEDQSATARISAARSILEYGMRMTEQLDVLDRLDALEAAIEGERD